MKTTRNLLHPRTIPPVPEKAWYRFENLSDGADVYIYNEIGFFGVTASDFVRELAAVNGPINLHINSPGGDVFQGIAIYTALKNRSGVTCYVDGIAASAASFIACACDKVVMGQHTTMMIHDAIGGGAGNADDFRAMAERLDSCSNDIARIYQEKGGGLTKTWRTRMKNETWLSDEQAVAVGLADEVASVKKTSNQLQAYDLSSYNHPPSFEAKDGFVFYNVVTELEDEEEEEEAVVENHEEVVPPPAAVVDPPVEEQQAAVVERTEPQVIDEDALAERIAAKVIELLAPPEKIDYVAIFREAFEQVKE